MTRNEMTDQAVRRGFRKLYPYEGTQRREMRTSLAVGFVTDFKRNAILIAWDRLIASQHYPSPTPKSAGPQAPSFPMNKADHAGGLAIKERA